jgi:hypothetical protein
MTAPLRLIWLFAVTFVVLTAPSARANECDKLTFLTFSGPIALPGVFLPAGTYRFVHPDCSASGGILRVSSRDGRHVYGTFLTIPSVRTTATTEPEVTFAEAPRGAPESIQGWFYPGETVGDELIYPKHERVRRG